MKIGLHPPEVRAINLDTDWIYRKLLPSLIVRSGYILSKFIGSTVDKWKSVRNSGEKFLSSSFGPTANLAKIFTSGAMILWITVIFSGALIIVLF
jgi:multicomponent Na+:H+ antiporter subunit D